MTKKRAIYLVILGAVCLSALIVLRLRPAPAAVQKPGSAPPPAENTSRTDTAAATRPPSPATPYSAPVSGRSSGPRAGAAFAMNPAAREAYADQNAQRAISLREKAHALAIQNGLLPEGIVNGREFAWDAVINGRIYVKATCNQNAAISTATDAIRQSSPYHLDGSGLTIGLWDGGSPRHSHREFEGRTRSTEQGSTSSHATHVCGTLCAVGIKPAAKGMAPAVSIVSYDWDNDYGEMALAGMAAPSETNMIQVSNHSYGYQAGWFDSIWYGTWGASESDGFGLYDTFCAQADEVCYGAPYLLPFKAAGNDRSDSAPAAGSVFTYFSNGVSRTKSYVPGVDPPSDNWDSGGYDTIPYDANAKNIMTVGAVSDAVAGSLRQLSEAVVTSFSAWGPADDGRVKPDIVANGSGLNSATGSGDAAYQTLSGTSMACPNAAGTGLLLTEHYQELFPGQAMLASTLKGLMIHTADDLGRPGPDYIYGWGLLNALAAAQHIDRHASSPDAFRMHEDRLQPGWTNRISFAWNNTSAIKATLCWTDPPGTEKFTLDDRTPVLVHDLDLRIIAPDGSVYRPFVLNVNNPVSTATTGDNDVDNVEQVIIAAPSLAGDYEVVISAKNEIADEGQRYSLLLSGVGVAPVIDHTPLANTTSTSGFYRVDAEIFAEIPLDANALEAAWSSSPAATGGIASMISLGGGRFRAEIPAQPTGSTVRYYISASTESGLTRTSPETAPATQHVFQVVLPVSLEIVGAPADYGQADPAYGTYFFPSGITVHAAVNQYSPPQDDERQSCTGWTGTGSVVPAGTGTETTFVLREPSTLTWNWNLAYRLRQLSTPPGIIAGDSWWTAGSTAHTATAVSTIDVAGTNYSFTGWTVDGNRKPDATNTAVNPVNGIIMDTPATAVAAYLPTAEDADADGLPDWWELFHMGSTAAQPNLDLDGDGFSNLFEWRDRTSPRDPLSVPSAPWISHTPLTNPQSAPADWPVSARVEDNHAVSMVELQYRRNAEAWQNRGMVETEPGIYTNSIPAPGVSGDTFSYRIVATDTAGLTSVNGNNIFEARYPVMRLSTNDLAVLNLADNTSGATPLTIHNDGHAALNWSVTSLPTGFRENVENGANGWTHGGSQDAWTLSAFRAYSGSNSWYFGSEITRRYPDRANAWLVSPLTYVSTNAVFSFWHWLHTETLKDPTHAWDAAIVEISTDRGISWEQIEPRGGYPYRMYGHSASPFPDETPVLAGSGTGWEYIEFPLDAYAGETVKVRLHFGSDGYVVEEGWYVDDLEISPFGGTGEWLSYSATEGTAGEQSDSVLIAVRHTRELGYGETRNGVIRLESNDPVIPMHLVTLGVHNISRHLVVDAIGNGNITPRGDVIVSAEVPELFTIAADPYHHLTDILENGTPLLVPGLPVDATNFLYSAEHIASTGRLQAVFAPNLATNSVPEIWMVQFGLTNGDFNAQALLDQDGDGHEAWQEFVTGNDPTNPLSVFRIESLWPAWTATTGTSRVVLEWPSASNRTYTLYLSTNTPTATIPVLELIPATPPLNVHTMEVTGGQAVFYRLGVSLDEN